MATETAAAKRPYHEVVAELLIEQIKAGSAPWQKPWSSQGMAAMLPLNPTTGNRYRGINALFLMAQGRPDNRWLTYKQAQVQGWQVRKGERGVPIQYWKFEDTRAKRDESGRALMGSDGKETQERYRLDTPRVFYATVFNAAQIDGIPVPTALTREMGWEPIERAEQIIAASGAKIAHQLQDGAFYRPSSDSIHMPLPVQFSSAEDYYAVLMHELGHWTGHESRLARDIKHPYGSVGYAREELRAEIASMIISAELGLPHDPSRHASYVQSWLEVISKDPLEIFRAAADAQKIATFVNQLAPALNQADDPEFGLEDKLNQPMMGLPIGGLRHKPLSFEEVRHALTFISSDLPRDEWVRIGMAIKSQFFGDDGLQLFDEWSQRGEYDQGSVLSTWRSISTDGPVSMGTLVRAAQEGGWRRDSFVPGTTPPTAAPSIQTELTVVGTEDRLQVQEEVAGQAQALWDRGQVGVSPYLERKGVEGFETRVDDRGVLLVPMRDVDGVLWNVQRILSSKTPQGNDKFYLKGGKKSGLMHLIGEVQPDAPLLIAEGYATAASLHQLTGLPVAVAFDGGNLSHVAQSLRAKFPDQRIVIAADDDIPTMLRTGRNPGREKALKAAQNAQAEVIFPEGLSSPGKDFNDLHSQLGDAAKISISNSLKKVHAKQELMSDWLAQPVVLEPIVRRNFESQDRQQAQDEAIALVTAKPQEFLSSYLADPRSFEGRYVSADLFKEIFQIYSQSPESRTRLNAPLHNSAAVLGAALFRQLLVQDDPVRDTVEFLTGIPGAGKTSMVLTQGAIDPKVRVLFEGQMADAKTTLEKVQQVLDAGLKPVISVVHVRPEIALENTLLRFDKIGRGASIGVMSRIQGGLPDSLKQVRDSYGDRVSLRIYDQTGRFGDEPRILDGWEHLDVLKSEGNEHEIKQKLERELDSKRDLISEAARLHALGQLAEPERRTERSDAGGGRSPIKGDEANANGSTISSQDHQDGLLTGSAPTPNPPGSAIVNEIIFGGGPERTQTDQTASWQTNVQPSTRLEQVLVKFAAEYQFDGVSKYYFRDPGAPLLAFEVVDKVFGKHLATPHAAPEVLSSMAELAQAMGWKDLTVKGTPEFKREMWLQGSLAGLKVWGYGPEPIDEIRLAELEALREKAAGVSPNVRAQGALNEVIEGGGLAPGVKAAAVAPLAGSDGSQDKPRSAAQAVATLEGARAQRLRVELEQSLNNLGTSDVIKEGVLNQFKQETFQRAYVGKLVEFGAAPYKFEKDAPRSFFVKLRTPGQKERVLWGVDFERLLQGEDDLIGKQLAFMLKVGQPIKIKVDVKDANGEVVGTEERQSVRNEWVMHSIEALVQSIVSSQEGHAQKVPAQSYQTASDLVQLEAQSLTPTEQLKQVLTGMGATTASVEMTIKSLESLVGSPQFHVGQYLSDGPVDYKGRSSHAIRLKTPDGPIEVVGADIKRALGEIQVKVGEPMVVAYRGIESVTDLEGNITHRNDWLVSPVGELHEQAQEGVIQRYALSGQKPGPTVMPDQGGLAKPDRQRLEILATAMRLAKVPAEFANLTLVQAHHMLQSGPAQAPRAAIPVTPSRTIQIDRPRKGPSI